MSSYDRSVLFQKPERRERMLFARLQSVLEEVQRTDPRYATIDPGSIDGRAVLATLPLNRKSDLPRLHDRRDPLGTPNGAWRRIYVSPGPIFEIEDRVAGVWQSAAAMDAAGFREGDIILNTFAYHLVPGGFIVEDGADMLSCPVIAAGPADSSHQIEIIRRLQPSAYAGTADYLRILTSRYPAGEPFPIKRAFISGGAFPQNLREAFDAQGIDCFESYATAELGVIAYETAEHDGFVINENLIVEIVDETGQPVADGEVGEVVVTKLGPGQPWIRLATGDLSATLEAHPESAYTNTRLRGWLGRSDQATKVRGMFIRPEQVARIVGLHAGIGPARLEVSRVEDRDRLAFVAERGALEATGELTEAVAASVSSVCGLSAHVEWVPAGTLEEATAMIVDHRSTARER